MAVTPPSAPPTVSPLSSRSTTPSIPSASSRAARAQANGIGRLGALMKKYSSNSAALLDVPADTPSSASHTEPSEEEKEETERRAVERDHVLVDEELDQYFEEALEELDDNFDLLKYWDQNERKFPMIYCIALDVLPVQVSSVPCECVFSSSKETDVDRRCNLTPLLMEMLQVLKFNARQQRLTFTDNWLSTEAELLSLDISPDELKQLRANGETNELLELMQLPDRPRCEHRQ